MRQFFTLVLLLLSVQVQAASFYGEARVAAGGVRHSDLDFYPGFTSFTAGVFIFENIGFEAFVDVPLVDGSRNNFELGITQAAGAAIRLQSPDQRGLQAYLLFGYVGFTLEQEENNAQGLRTVEQTFSGARISVGLQQRLKIVDGLIFGVEYLNYYSDSGIAVDGLSAGLRFELK